LDFLLDFYIVIAYKNKGKSFGPNIIDIFEKIHYKFELVNL